MEKLDLLKLSLQKSRKQTSGINLQSRLICVPQIIRWIFIKILSSLGTCKYKKCREFPTQQFLWVNLESVDLGFGSRKKPQSWSNKLSSFILQRFGKKLITSTKSGVWKSNYCSQISAHIFSWNVFTNKFSWNTSYEVSTYPQSVIFIWFGSHTFLSSIKNKHCWFFLVIKAVYV